MQQRPILKPFVIVVSGTRHSLTERGKSTVRTVLMDGVERAHLANLIQKDRQIVLVHGGCRGVDTVAGEIAKSLRWHVKVYPADWKKHGKAAGPKRNDEMLTKERPNIVIAFAAHDSKGTRQCLELASKYKLEYTCCELKQGTDYVIKEELKDA